MTIGEMKKGKKCARKGWNGKDMFVVYMPPQTTEQLNT